MPVTGLDERLARMRAGLVKRGVVNSRQPDGSPWAMSVPEAAAALGLTEGRVRLLIRRGLLRACQLDEPVVAMVHVRAYLNGRR